MGTGSEHYARDFKHERRIAFPVLIDEALLSYRAVEAKKARPAELLSASVLAGGLRALRRGNLQGRTGKHPLILGATHVIRPDGSVPFAWRNADYADNPDLALVLAALTPEEENA